MVQGSNLGLPCLANLEQELGKGASIQIPYF